MRTFILLFKIVIVSTLISASAVAQIDTSLLSNSLRMHLETYPEGRLQDIYKTFYQDRFGPGHLMLADTSMPMYYLNQEMQTKQEWLTDKPYYESTGFQGNYVRVYLSCVRPEGFTLRRLCDAFVRSAGMTVELPISWADEWHLILQIVEQNGWQMADYERDKAMIEELLSAGDQPITHSRNYNAHYHPHYRIVTREIFEKEIMPMLER